MKKGKLFKQKIITSLAIVLILFNFIFPPRSHAIVSEIADTLQSLVCWLGDAVLNGLQEFFMGEPAVFETATSYQQKLNEENVQTAADNVVENGSPMDYLVLFGAGFNNVVGKFGPIAWAQQKFSSFMGWSDYDGPVALVKYSVANIVSNQIPAFDVNFFKTKSNKTEAEKNGKKSTAEELRKVVQKWYYAFRNIGIVALLSVLLYLGIKIVLSSAASEKAKYKNSIKNWLVAVLLIFSLHYIMAFTLNIIDEANGVLKQKIIVKNADVDENGNVKKDANGNIKYSEYDGLISIIRVAAEMSEDYTDNMTYTLMYIVLIVYTVMFTIIYFKRTIYLVFLTIIAPLVAITYPIDKEKDGKSQAFDMWFKEYMFNAIIQPIHLILYYVLVVSAIELVSQNNLYALVAIGFMLPAEKLIRQMFGMEQHGNDSALGGFAGGALASQAISSLGKLRSAKSNKSKEKVKDADNKDSNIKMAKMDDVFGKDGNSNRKDDSKEAQKEAKEGQQSAQNNIQTGQQQQKEARRKELEKKLNQNKKQGADAKKQQSKQKGIMEKAKNKLNNVKQKPGFKGAGAVARYTLNKAKGGVKKLPGAALRTSVAAAGLTFGVAAGIANGNMSDAIKYGALGAGAGRGAANLTIKGVKKVGGGAIDAGKNVKQQYLKGYYGDEQEYQKNVLIPKLKAKNEKDKELQAKYAQAGIDMKKSTGRNALYDKGYANEDEILRALKVQQKTGISDDDLVKAAVVSKNIGKFADVEPVKKAVMNKLQSQGWEVEKAQKETEKLIENAKKISGLT